MVSIPVPHHLQHVEFDADLISRLTQSRLRYTSYPAADPTSLSAYFVQEIEQFRELAALGLLNMDDDWITVSLKGRLLIRNICMVFDRYSQQARRLQSESQS